MPEWDEGPEDDYGVIQTPLAPAHLPGPGRTGSRLLILPTLDEEGGLEVTLKELAAAPFANGAERPSILVVDGHSTDGTAAVAQRWGVPVLLQDGRGKGLAVREALAWGRWHGFRTAAVIDADGTYPAAALSALFDLLESRQDVVIGVRRAPPLERAGLRDLVHRVGNSMLNYAAAQASGKSLLDVCSGFWGVRLDAVDRLALCSDGFEIESELFVKAFRRGLRVAQIPVAYRGRTGTAKLHAARDGTRILLSIFRHSLRRRGVPRSTDSEPDDRTADPLALVFGLRPARLIVLSSPERIGEAERIAERVTAGAPSVGVTTALLPPDAPNDLDGQLLAALVAPSVEQSAPTIVTLLPPLSADGGAKPVFVGIPRTQRLLFLAPRPDRTTEQYPVEIAARMGFHRERVPTGRLGAWFILAASLERSGTQKELAILRANAGEAPLQSFRRTIGRPVAARPGARHPFTLPGFDAPGPEAR